MNHATDWFPVLLDNVTIKVESFDEICVVAVANLRFIQGQGTDHPKCKKAAHQDQDDPEIETARWRTGVVFRLIGVLTIVFHFGLVPDPDAAAAIWLDRLDVKR